MSISLKLRNWRRYPSSNLIVCGRDQFMHFDLLERKFAWLN